MGRGPHCPTRTRRRWASAISSSSKPPAAGVTGRSDEMSGFAEELDVAKSSLKAALAQLAATADVLRIISRSAGDLKPVFDAILEKATALCDADLGMVHLYRDGKQRTVAHRG